MPMSELFALNQTERLRRIENFVINFPRLQRVREQLAWCQQHSQLTTEPECLFITGPTGAGKTTLCQNYARQYPRRATAEGIGRFAQPSHGIPVTLQHIFSKSQNAR